MVNNYIIAPIITIHNANRRYSNTSQIVTIATHRHAQRVCNSFQQLVLEENSLLVGFLAALGLEHDQLLVDEPRERLVQLDDLVEIGARLVEIPDGHVSFSAPKIRFHAFRVLGDGVSGVTDRLVEALQQTERRVIDTVR